MKRIVLATAVVAMALVPSALGKAHHPPRHHKPRHHHPAAKLKVTPTDWLVGYDVNGQRSTVHVPLGGTAQTCPQTHPAYFVGLEFRWRHASPGSFFEASVTGPPLSNGPRDETGFEGEFPHATGRYTGLEVHGLNSNTQARQFSDGLVPGSYSETVRLSNFNGRRLASSRLTIVNQC